MSTGASARAAALLFDMSDRGLVAVAGEDRVRWLDGMVSNKVSALAPGPARSGCLAALLTPQGRIVAELRVLLRDDGFWLELARELVAPVVERLERYVIADDVALRDATGDRARLGLEGAGARACLARACRGALPALAADCIADVELAGVRVEVAAFGWSGEDAFQLFVPPRASDDVAAALAAAGAERAARAELEVLRVEAGVPATGSELSEDTLPDEANLGRAISTSKGCYTGQEVIARLRSRGGVKYRLVGIRPAAPGGALPGAGAAIERADGRRSGELSSRVESAAAGGAIGLGFVHRDDAEPGTELVCDGARVVVCALPFVAPASAALPNAGAPGVSGAPGPANARGGGGDDGGR